MFDYIFIFIINIEMSIVTSIFFLIVY